MTVQSSPFTIRINNELMDKFKVVASENGRSVNKEIEMLIKAAVAAYETEHGPITVQHGPL